MRRLYRRLVFIYSEGGLGNVLQKALAFTLSTLYSEVLWTIYTRKKSGDAEINGGLAQCRELQFQDLMDAQYFKAAALPEEIRLRFGRRNTCYGFYFEGKLAVVGWRSDGYLELDHDVVVPCPSSVGLFDFM